MYNQPQKFWRYLSKPENPTLQIEIAGSLTHDAYAIANAFNAHFQSVFTHSSRPSDVSFASDSVMPAIVITEPGILNLLVNIDTKKKRPVPITFPMRF